MHVIITEGTQVFECETDYLKDGLKTRVDEYLRDHLIDVLDHMFWKNDEPVVNTFVDKKNWVDEGRKVEDERKKYEELKTVMGKM